MNTTNQQVKIDLKNAEDIQCEECENIYFIPTYIIKRLSALLSPTGQEILAPVQNFQCSKCAHVNKKFLA